jgi:hypothetical protein
MLHFKRCSGTTVLLERFATKLFNPDCIIAAINHINAATDLRIASILSKATM